MVVAVLWGLGLARELLSLGRLAWLETINNGDRFGYNLEDIQYYSSDVSVEVRRMAGA